MTAISTSQAQAMLHTMADMQEQHNVLVHPQWREQGFEFYRAMWVECAEMLDHFGWKWWKQQTPDIDQVKLELVDIWHFALSELMRERAIDPAVAEQLATVSVDKATDPEGFRLAIETLAAACLSTRSIDLSAFCAAMAALPMDYAELYALYIGKNMLNRFRQNNGYKSGEYRKLWQGREDNEHLIELLDELSDVPEQLPERLYAGLEARYAIAN
ncbi:MAG: dUTP diphosphatase [Pseudomonadota bacterium]|nr:dUTP diphosphatase [Pseudomonadales bacterium]MEC7076804.1 dUTP diphosphatase [Pseudomonadota bacterium]MEC7250123.1 dUTP diphosphatase [Pseudomonadota bacterium]MEC7414750.1 dUTP diphosphatase [Pseudomonadota bacterium]MEC7559919.1 dUTP diphosphatase [Pseudomonadota bacterium]|tara:strand:+ start:4866 stop:5510 length:645 start_codon:yes stop_codon:yes gene_type:complete